MFERAVKIVPEFAAAWAGLANTYVDLFRWGRKRRDLEEAQRASQHALQLDPNSAEAMFLSARLSPFNDVLWRRQLRLIERSRKTRLFSKHIIFTVERWLKAETLRRPLKCLKRRKPCDRRISNRGFCGRRR